MDKKFKLKEFLEERFGPRPRPSEDISQAHGKHGKHGEDAAKAWRMLMLGGIVSDTGQVLPVV